MGWRDVFNALMIVRHNYGFLPCFWSVFLSSKIEMNHHYHCFKEVALQTHVSQNLTLNLTIECSTVLDL